MINVTIWHEYTHEKCEEEIGKLYPEGMHAVIKSFQEKDEELNIRLATIDDPEQGLPDEILNNTDVLLWWGHMRHGEVSDTLVDKIKNRVFKSGMGLVALHSAHESKPFRAIIGTDGALTWGDEQPEIMWNLMPSHPIANGIPENFFLEKEELYAEPFNIPVPECVVFGGWFSDGHIMRTGCCFLRGLGRIFYFQPGHESCRSYYNEYVEKIINNAIHWAAPKGEFCVETPRHCKHEKVNFAKQYGIVK